MVYIIVFISLVFEKLGRSRKDDEMTFYSTVVYRIQYPERYSVQYPVSSAVQCTVSSIQCGTVYSVQSSITNTFEPYSEIE